MGSPRLPTAYLTTALFSVDAVAGGNAGGREIHRLARQHDDAGADRAAQIELRDILVQHADAAGRHRLADRGRLVGAVDAEQRVLVVIVEQVKRAGTQRVLRTARHAVGEGTGHRVTLDHLLGREPPGPFRLAADLGAAGPFEALAADTDAVAHREPLL